MWRLLGKRFCGTGDEDGLIMGEQGLESRESNLPYVFLLAGIGYACFIGWGLVTAFTPNLMLLSYVSLEEAMIARICSVVTMAITFAFCLIKADAVLDQRRRALLVGGVCAALTLVSTLVNLLFEGIPFAVTVVVWALLGVAQSCLTVYWCIFFSLMPTRYTSLTVALGSLAGTWLFVLANLAGPVLAGLAVFAALAITSIGLVAFLLEHAASSRALPSRSYERGQLPSLSASVSSSCQGVVYGFVTIMFCAMGAVPSIVAGASGTFGVLLALLWAKLAHRIDIDNGIIQRISLPFIVVGLLIMPFVDETLRIACGGLVVAALSHMSVSTWAVVTVGNSEFGLHPVDRFAAMQLPTWAGFCVGALLAFCFFIAGSVSDAGFARLCAGLVIVTVVSFCWYGGDESSARKQLDELILARAPNCDSLGEKRAEGVCADAGGSLAAGEERGTGAPEGTEAPEGVESAGLAGFGSVADAGGAAACAGGVAAPAGDLASCATQADDSALSFNERCEAIAMQCGLTPRETEVFYLLARGRNASYIGSKLCVSGSTVKSHIYHIYQKLGINSQQSLMSIVDERNDAVRD